MLYVCKCVHLCEHLFVCPFTSDSEQPWQFPLQNRSLCVVSSLHQRGHAIKERFIIKQTISEMPQSKERSVRCSKLRDFFFFVSKHYPQWQQGLGSLCRGVILPHVSFMCKRSERKERPRTANDKNSDILSSKISLWQHSVMIKKKTVFCLEATKLN